MPFKMPSKKFLFYVFIVMWGFLCLHTLIYRPLIRKHKFPLYKELFFITNREEKIKKVIGSDLYEYIRFCNVSLPQWSFYSTVGLDSTSLEARFISYYLFPHVSILPELPIKKGKKADYILVYKQKNYFESGYQTFAALSEDRFILKKEDR